MRTIYWFISFWIDTIFVSFSIPRANRLEKQNRLEERRGFAHRAARKWAARVLHRTGSNIQITGLDHIPQDQPVLFVSNHQGNFDIPILLAHLPKPLGFVAKVELKKLPLVNRWMELLDCVFIDRNDMRQSLRTITKAMDLLKSGHSMVIFPEGTRSKGDEIGAFKPGSLKMAARAGVSIVPITIKGSYKIMEANGNRIKPANVQVIIAKPIDTTGLDKSTDLTAMVFNQIKTSLEQS